MENVAIKERRKWRTTQTCFESFSPLNNVVTEGVITTRSNRMKFRLKILRIWITIIPHGSLGHEVQESWPYLSNATPWPYVKWVTKDFLQTHGRAIGTKRAVSSKIETAIIDQHNTKPLVWKRYIDDVFSLGTQKVRTRVLSVHYNNHIWRIYPGFLPG